MIGIVFPGQGSQKPGMGKELHDAHATAREVFDRVSNATGQDLRALCFETDEETLRKTQNAQLALFTTSVAAFHCLKPYLDLEKLGGMAGHSVGEYAALACAEVLDIETGARLVQLRGLVMAEAGTLNPGTMAAVLGLDREALEDVCNSVPEVVVVANDNCPGQLVISGSIEGVAQASALAQEKGAKRVLPLNVSGAFHSPLMEEPAAEFAKALKEVSFGPGVTPVYSNVTAEPAMDGERWITLLEEQLRSPVRWTESVGQMISDGMTTFVECGSGEVLSGLIRRISKEVRTLSVGTPESLDATVSTLG
jgi:[acyl-carrier-protein] S-malonyltransferase